MNGDWLTTAKQSLPRLKKLVHRLEPTFVFPDIRSITPEFVEREQIRGIIWDVDGTLMSYHGSAIDPALLPTVNALSECGVVQAVLSNCGEDRFVRLGTMFPEWPTLRGYQTAEGHRRYRVLKSGLDDPGPEEVARILSSGGFTVRKPDGDLLREALRVLDVEPEHGLMVGDQYLTDVASANLAGVRSVKVPAWRGDTFPIAVKASQTFERLLYRFRPRSSYPGR